MVRGLKKLPKFASWEQEEHFWETHSSVGYDFEKVAPEEHLRLNPQRKVSRRSREVYLKNPFAASYVQK